MGNLSDAWKKANEELKNRAIAEIKKSIDIAALKCAVDTFHKAVIEETPKVLAELKEFGFKEVYSALPPPDGILYLKQEPDGRYWMDLSSFNKEELFYDYHLFAWSFFFNEVIEVLCLREITYRQTQQKLLMSYGQAMKLLG